MPEPRMEKQMMRETVRARTMDAGIARFPPLISADGNPGDPRGRSSADIGIKPLETRG